jgi:hypothetical protein
MLFSAEVRDDDVHDHKIRPALKVDRRSGLGRGAWGLRSGLACRLRYWGRLSYGRGGCGRGLRRWLRRRHRLRERGRAWGRGNHAERRHRDHQHCRGSASECDREGSGAAARLPVVQDGADARRQMLG